MVQVSVETSMERPEWAGGEGGVGIGRGRCLWRFCGQKGATFCRRAVEGEMCGEYKGRSGRRESMMEQRG